jgi:hypothetical protein
MLATPMSGWAELRKSIIDTSDSFGKFALSWTA